MRSSAPCSEQSSVPTTPEQKGAKGFFAPRLSESLLCRQQPPDRGGGRRTRFLDLDGHERLLAPRPPTAPTRRIFPRVNRSAVSDRRSRPTRAGQQSDLDAPGPCS